MLWPTSQIFAVSASEGLHTHLVRGGFLML